MMTDTISIQLKHRTIREFKEDEIPKEDWDLLMEVAKRTATSNGMQTYSLIRVTDPKLKEEISKVCKQEYVKRAPELLIFIVDQNRNYNIVKERGADLGHTNSMDLFIQGFTDGALAIQNIVNAAESMGLGALYLGSILNNPKEIIRLLNLPQLTFPILGLGLGYPNQDPQLKPRMDMKFRVFENTYRESENILEELKDYDEEMQTYYDLRNANKRVDSFTDQVVFKYTNFNPIREEIVNDIVSQGFDLKLR